MLDLFKRAKLFASIILPSKLVFFVLAVKSVCSDKCIWDIVNRWICEVCSECFYAENRAGITFCRFRLNLFHNTNMNSI